MEVHIIIVVFSVFLAAFTQSLSGFGSALIAMAMLPPILGLKIATPLVALLIIPLEISLIVHYRHALNIAVIWRVVFASLVGIPFGIFFLSQLNESIVLGLLGIVISGYALFALFQFRLPNLVHPAWSYIIGLLAGVLGGAYNTAGPPVIIYGNSLGWNPDEFKSNLQGFFLVSSLVILGGHAWNGNITPEVWRYFLITLPALAIGIAAGVSLDRIVSPESFRKIVLVALVILGLRLIIIL
jgi:uncharacterized membrane protein YfcA